MSENSHRRHDTKKYFTLCFDTHHRELEAAAKNWQATAVIIVIIFICDIPPHPTLQNQSPINRLKKKKKTPTKTTLFQIAEEELTLAVVHWLCLNVVFGAVKLDGVGYLGRVGRQRNPLQVFAFTLDIIRSWQQERHLLLHV